MPNDHVENNWSYSKTNKKIKCRPYDKNTIKEVSSELYIKEWHWFASIFLYVFCFPFYVKVHAH